MGSGLSAFICYEKKNPKYVNNTDCISQPYKRSEYFDNSYRIGMRDDICIDLFVRESPKVEG